MGQWMELGQWWPNSRLRDELIEKGIWDVSEMEIGLCRWCIDEVRIRCRSIAENI